MQCTSYSLPQATVYITLTVLQPIANSLQPTDYSIAHCTSYSTNLKYNINPTVYPTVQSLARSKAKSTAKGLQKTKSQQPEVISTESSKGNECGEIGFGATRLPTHALCVRQKPEELPIQFKLQVQVKSLALLVGSFAPESIHPNLLPLQLQHQNQAQAHAITGRFRDSVA